MKSALHEDEKQQFQRLLSQLRMGAVDDRMAFAEAFFNSEEHHTVEGWQKFMRRRGLPMEPTFVEQNLELLSRFGLATKREFENESPRYEHHHLGEHHDHLICTSCGGIEEFYSPELERVQEESARAKGFMPMRHRLQIYGLCSKCLAKRPPLRPLSSASPGERVRVERMPHGEGACRRLDCMGICKGAELQVLSSGFGPMVVAVHGTRLALGHGQADKIMVSDIK